MIRHDLIALYNKERDYESCCFGKYSDIKALNPASFLIFIRTYLEKAEKAYSGPWTKNIPDWLRTCYELGGLDVETAPVEVYANMIKVMALAGAFLETYADIIPEEWRTDMVAEGQKWLKEK